MKPYVCICLLSVFLLSLLAGCAGVEAPVEDSTQQTTESETDEIAAALAALSVDWEGEELVILGRSDQFAEDLIAEQSSDVLESAVYGRNLALEETCKLTLNCVGAGTDELSDMVKADIKSGTGEYHVVHHHMAQTAKLASDGQLISFTSLDGVNLSAPWWDAGTASFVIADQVYFMNSAINVSDERTTYVMMFNKQLAKDKSIDPYALVYNNEWTLDTFGSLIRDVSYDSSGDGKYDENDTYGFIVTWETGNTFFFGSGLKFVECEQGKDPYLALDTSGMNKASDLLDKVLDIYYVNHATYVPGTEEGAEKKGMDAFRENRGLFYTEVVMYIVALGKSMEGDFGVLPIPKYDSAQKEYITWTNAICSTTSIPVSAQDTDKLGQTLEIMAILSQQRVTPAFYDTVLQRKSVRDEESQGMLDIIFKTRCYDMSIYYDLGLEPLFKESVNDNKTNFASNYNKKASKAEYKLESLLKKFAEEP